MPPRKKKKSSSQTKVGLHIDGSESIRIKNILEEGGAISIEEMGKILGVTPTCENQHQDKACRVRIAGISIISTFES